MKNFFKKIKDWLTYQISTKEKLTKEKLTKEESLYAFLEVNKDRFNDLFNHVIKGNINYCTKEEYVDLAGNGNFILIKTLNEVKRFNSKPNKIYKYKEGDSLSPETKFYLNEIKKSWDNHEISFRESLPKGVTLESELERLKEMIFNNKQINSKNK